LDGFESMAGFELIMYGGFSGDHGGLLASQMRWVSSARYPVSVARSFQ
jgi:hypothetical protein